MKFLMVDNKISWKYIVSCLAIVLFAQVAWTQTAIPPKSNILVNDYARILSSTEKRALERKLVDYNDSTSTQIAVVIGTTLNGEDIFDYSYRLAQAWGIGQGEKNNGVLIYIAFEDKKVRIQTGYGAEGFLPDAMAKRIIDNVISPAFKQQQYYRGLDDATNVIIQLAEGEYKAEDILNGDGGGGFPIFLIFLIIMLIFILANRRGGGNDDDDDGGYYRGGRYEERRHRGRRGGGGWIFLPGGGGGNWHTGGGGGGFGGGGFGGFGGGSFGGGGAGGGW